MVSTNKPVNGFLGFDSKTFGDRLTEERKRLRLSQADVRIRTGVGKNAQINYEAGATIPDAEYLWFLHGAGFDLMYMLTGERSPEAPLAPELQNLLEAYMAAPVELKRAVFGVLLSPYKADWDKPRVIPGYFRHEVLGEDDTRFEAHHAQRRAEAAKAEAPVESALKPDEAALLDHYRNMSPEKQAALREAGAAFEKPLDDGEAHCA